MSFFFFLRVCVCVCVCQYKHAACACADLLFGQAAMTNGLRDVALQAMMRIPHMKAPRLPEPERFDPKINNFINHCLQKKPFDRLETKQLAEVSGGFGAPARQC